MSQIHLPACDSLLPSASHRRHHGDGDLDLNGHLANAFSSAVRKRCTLTWSLSATSIPESPPPLVSQRPTRPRRRPLFQTTRSQYTTGHLIYKCGGIDKRTIEKFEKVRIFRCCLKFTPHLSAFLLGLSQNLPLGGATHNQFFCARAFTPQRLAAIAAQQQHNTSPFPSRHHHITAS